MTFDISLHEECVRVGVRYVITKFSRMDSLPNFLTHGAPQARALRARELRYNTFKKKQICDFLQLDKITKNVYSHYTKFFFSISIFYDGALPPVLTRHCFTIFVLKSVKHSICMAHILKNI